MKVVRGIVNFIRVRGLNYRLFQSFLSKESDSDHGDVVYYCGVRWLNCANLFKRIAKLKDAIQEFMTSKNRPGHEFNAPEFIAHFAFLADIFNHLLTVNVKFQQKGQLIHVLFLPYQSIQRKIETF